MIVVGKVVVVLDGGLHPSDLILIDGGRDLEAGRVILVLVNWFGVDGLGLLGPAGDGWRGRLVIIGLRVVIVRSAGEGCGWC